MTKSISLDFKILTWWWRWRKSERITIRIHPQGTLNICRKFHGNPSKSCWVRSNMHTTIPEKYLVCPNTQYVKYSMLKMPVTFCSMQAGILFLAWGSKFKAQCYDEVGRTNCMHTEGNNTYFVRTAAARTENKKKKYAIWNAAVH